VAVGDVIAEKLQEAGIAVIHDTTVHDYPSYNGAYERSAETVKAILAEYPSIRVVLDIHRDAIGTDTSISQPIAEINGKEAAQVMIISGCDDGTMDMPNYMLNFRFACRLQEQMESMYPGLTRPILFDYRKYNQDLTTGSLLIEVGSHGNTYEQAIYAGALLGDALAQVLLDLH
jgi:stage II sporulation protein P